LKTTVREDSKIADILTQEEIDTLLDVCEDEEYESGSPEFEKVLQDMKDDKITTPWGNDPSEIMASLEDMEKKFIQKIKDYEKFKVYYKRIQEIAKDQPEMFI